MENNFVVQDILPNPDGFAKKDFGQCAIRSDGVV
jgi:formamidase